MKGQTVSERFIEQKIFLIRGQKVLLSMHLAALYGVQVKQLIQSIKRNKERFPEDFIFQLSDAEYDNLKSQFVTSSWGGIRRATPYAFTEQGVAMLSSVLNSKRAIQVNIEIMRTFTKLREMIISHEDLQRKINEMEKKYDHNFSVVFQTLRELLEKPKIDKPIKQIGIRWKEE